MTRALDIKTGERYGGWLVIALTSIAGRTGRAYLCRCACGAERVQRAERIAGSSRVERCSECRMRPVAPDVRFWAKVDRSGGPDACWPWTAYRDDDGYGRFTPTVGGAPVAAHRYAWELENGPIGDGLVLRHFKCDNRPCVNPAHMLPGTVADNQADMVRHGRSLRGESNPLARLTWEQAAEIRTRYGAGGVTLRQLAAEYGVAFCAIQRIASGASYVPHKAALEQWAAQGLDASSGEL